MAGQTCSGGSSAASAGYSTRGATRRTRTHWWVGVSLWWLLLFLMSPALAQCETRATWLEPSTFDTAERRAATLQELQDCHINVVFLPAPPIGGNYGTSDPAAFQAFSDLLKDAGFKVHIWVMNMHRLSWDGQVDFRDPAERDAQVQWALDLLAAYPRVDGFHLDYIRYDDWADPDERMDAVTQTVRQIHEAIQTHYPGKLLSAAVFTDHPNWGPEGQFPQWFLDWCAAHPGNTFEDESGQRTACPEFFKVQQDPITWLKEGYLDAICPMEYTSNDEAWEGDLHTWRDFCDFLGLDFSTRIIMGIGWLREEGIPDWDYDTRAHVAHVKFGEAEGLDGYSIYTLGWPDAPVDDYELINALTTDGPLNNYDAPWKTDVEPCFTSGPPAPAARFSVSPTHGPPPLTVTFTDRSRGGATAWTWDFGDGETSYLQHPTHTYADFGCYTVSLEVITPSGPCTDTRTKLITVGFSDIDFQQWAADYIIAAAKAGIVKGFPEGDYRPSLSVTRDQMAVYVSRALAGGDEYIPTGPAQPTFSDVPADHWAYRWVEYAHAEGIVAGYDDGTYRPTVEVDRGQMAVYIARAIATPSDGVDLEFYTPPETPTFPDVPADFWAYNYIEYIAGRGVVSGYDDGTYRPDLVVTRDQMAVYIQRAFDLPM